MKVSYNDITIEYASITNWQEVAQYDSSGMNLIANRIELTIEGSIFPLAARLSSGAYAKIDGTTTNVTLNNYDSFSPTGPQPATSGFAFRLNYCLRQLSIPRQRFVLSNPITLETYFEAYPYTSDEYVKGLSTSQRRNLDVNGGPKPRNVRVIQTCNEFARISFTIEITKIRCLGGDLGTGDYGADPTEGFVVSNRCWTEETIDSNFYVTRTFVGRLRISSLTQSVHFYRDIYYPPLEDGFRRDSVRFAESEDGLELSYAIIDKQVRNAAPYPATAFSGNCSYSIINGAQQVFNINLTMVGRPDAPKRALVARCFQAVTAKIKEVRNSASLGGSYTANGLVQKMTLSENLGDPPSATIQVSYLLFGMGTESGDEGKQSAREAIEQANLPASMVIGKPIQFGSIKLNDDEPAIEYDRIRSSCPNPYGYNVYAVYDDERYRNSNSSGSSGGKSNTTGTESSGSGSSGSGSGSGGTESGGGSGTDTDSEKESPFYYGYIKCIATAPCLIPEPEYTTMPSKGNKTQDAKMSTKVVQDEKGTEYETSSSGAQQEAVDCPYSLYKSDISYYTDYSTVALPRAEKTDDETPTSSSSSIGAGAAISDGPSPSSAYTNEQLLDIIEDKEAELTSLRGELAIEKMTTTTTYGMADEPDSEIIRSLMNQIEEVKRELQELRQEQESRNSTKIIRFAKPVPKARVVIEAERFGRLPEMPNPDEIITTSGSNPIAFTCLKAETQLCEPRVAVNTTDSVSYAVIGTYEFAMSRAYQKGDEIWLLQNPTFAANNYYPKLTDTYGNKYNDVDAVKCLFNGKQLNHVAAQS